MAKSETTDIRHLIGYYHANEFVAVKERIFANARHPVWYRYSDETYTVAESVRSYVSYAVGYRYSFKFSAVLECGISDTRYAARYNHARKFFAIFESVFAYCLTACNNDGFYGVFPDSRYRRGRYCDRFQLVTTIKRVLRYIVYAVRYIYCGKSDTVAERIISDTFHSVGNRYSR